MNEIRITSNPKYLWWHSVIMILIGTVILGFLGFNYVTDELTDDHWYIELLFGLYVVYFGISNLTGRGLLSADEIVINDEVIRSNQSSGYGNSLRWKSLKKVKLYNDKIEGVSADSGHKNRLKIPFGMRFSSEKMQRLKDAVSDQCDRHGVLFEAKY